MFLLMPVRPEYIRRHGEPAGLPFSYPTTTCARCSHLCYRPVEPACVGCSLLMMVLTHGLAGDMRSLPGIHLNRMLSPPANKTKRFSAPILPVACRRVSTPLVTPTGMPRAICSLRALAALHYLSSMGRFPMGLDLYVFTIKRPAENHGGLNRGRTRSRGYYRKFNAHRQLVDASAGVENCADVP